MQQTDTTPLNGNNDPTNINTAQASDAIDKQIIQNKQDLTTAKDAIANSKADALTDEGKQNAAVVAAIISADPATSSESAAPVSNSGKKNKGGAANAQGAKSGGKNNRRGTPTSARWAKRRSYDAFTEE